MSSIPPIYSSPKAKIIEIINSAAHNSHISSNTTSARHGFSNLHGYPGMGKAGTGTGRNAHTRDI